MSVVISPFDGDNWMPSLSPCWISLIFIFATVAAVCFGLNSSRRWFYRLISLLLVVQQRNLKVSNNWIERSVWFLEVLNPTDLTMSSFPKYFSIKEFPKSTTLLLNANQIAARQYLRKYLKFFFQTKNIFRSFHDS